MIATYETACGPLWISGGKDAVDAVSWRPIEGPGHLGDLDWVLHALDSYFAGELRRFPGGLLFMGAGTIWVRNHTASHPMGTSQEILAAMERIPYGKTMTYGELATMVGKPGAARAVGAVCRANPIPILIPCHRVVGCSSLGGYSPGIHLKEFLLNLERVLR